MKSKLNFQQVIAAALLATIMTVLAGALMRDMQQYVTAHSCQIAGSKIVSCAPR